MIVGAGLLVALGVVIAAIVIGVRRSPAPRGGSAQPTVRRLIAFVLLFALVVIAAIGLAGLLGRLLDAGNALAGDDVAGLARSLAFTLVAGPFAALLWWVLRRRLDGEDRSSLAWGLYLAGIRTVALVVASTALLGSAAALVRADWQPRTLATGLVWAAVWVWHTWMSRNPATHPLRLPTAAIVLGSVFGLVIGTGGAVTALGALLDSAITGSGASTFAGAPWWWLPLEGLVWCAGGGAVWWWHWLHDRAVTLRGGLADVAFIASGIGGAAILTLAGAGTTVFVLLRLGFDRSGAFGNAESLTVILDPLGNALAAASMGAFVWAYHRVLVPVRGDQTRQAAGLVVSGIGLVGAASGLGVVVNSLLAALVQPLADSNPRTLLLGGISVMIAGGPVWCLAWRPLAPADPSTSSATARRVYLILVFGVSAVVALVALLLIGYRIFEFGLGSASGSPSGSSLLERVRAPLGLLIATGLAAGYHFAVWQRDRAMSAATPGRQCTIGRVILVTGASPEPLRRAITENTGASVTVWARAEGNADTTADAGAEAGTDSTAGGPSAAEITAALDGVTGKRVLVVTGPGSGVTVIRLRD
ncbi:MULTISPECIES: DUF5671 domain-containing protein [unclassified Cryobacterium]|uniref:DUF5671 domain-containing protein n=1 Tax=unclassified Cryobacterium TaxID=2649013 RepID=UPI002AB39DD1|nr:MULTISPECIES: DUF5671 domain-containing protein [unclassified Cryobacterium]MDY7526731.1 DUF5671 domain-containing protein [Cryobacterium sp. 10C2]MDY7557463.1 DUF5671 domain-containing protein [Cryobacterium sp. 10C3]MEB0290673.1 DUF5671 domain-containing protein [Cryobacterium sp. 10C2]